MTRGPRQAKKGWAIASAAGSRRRPSNCPAHPVRTHAHKGWGHAHKGWGHAPFPPLWVWPHQSPPRPYPPPNGGRVCCPPPQIGFKPRPYGSGLCPTHGGGIRKPRPPTPLPRGKVGRGHSEGPPFGGGAWGEGVGPWRAGRGAPSSPAAVGPAGQHRRGPAWGGRGGRGRGQVPPKPHYGAEPPPMGQITPLRGNYHPLWGNSPPPPAMGHPPRYGALPPLWGKSSPLWGNSPPTTTMGHPPPL